MGSTLRKMKNSKNRRNAENTFAQNGDRGNFGAAADPRHKMAKTLEISWFLRPKD